MAILAGRGALGAGQAAGSMWFAVAAIYWAIHAFNGMSKGIFCLARDLEQ